MKSQSSDYSLKGLIAAAVFLAHLGTFVALTTLTLRATRTTPPVPAMTRAFIIDGTPARDTVPIPEVALAEPKLDFKAIHLIQFEPAEWGDISAVTAPTSAPQLSRFQPGSAAVFARRAGLPAGQAASVVLTVEVLADGRAGAVEVARGSGDPAVDAAALAYGKLLRWIPGTQEHHAQVMRVSLAVTLVWSA